MLGHLRFPVEASRGRRYPEPQHPYRNAFQRDRDRVIHCRAFRRLEAKTQVFASGISDHFHNRLTHTIEVSQVARTVANVLGLNEDLTETLALVHDIGHPPFAHSGEAELRRQMESFGDTFDHNIHALRIVEKFEQCYPRFPGLNLSFEVREGIVKHSRDFGPGEVPVLEEYLPGQKPVIEAQLIDLADEVAYNAGDLDDAFSAGLIDPSLIAEHVPVFRDALETAETQYPGATGREQFLEALRAVTNFQVSGLVSGTVEAANEARATNYESVRHMGERIARFTRESGETSKQIKSVLHRFMYGSPVLDDDRKNSTLRIRQLFQAFIEDPERMPPNYVEAAIQAPVHRVVCDYIAGMTDSYFNRVYSSVVMADNSALRTP